jgi:hypothetical protein
MQSGLSRSAHFLKYAILASHLRPKVSGPELISALIAHFPTSIRDLVPRFEYAVFKTLWNFCSDWKLLKVKLDIGE